MFYILFLKQKNIIQGESHSRYPNGIVEILPFSYLIDMRLRSLIYIIFVCSFLYILSVLLSLTKLLFYSIKNDASGFKNNSLYISYNDVDSAYLGSLTIFSFIIL